jgi:hypothetical protein
VLDNAQSVAVRLLSPEHALECAAKGVPGTQCVIKDFDNEGLTHSSCQGQFVNKSRFSTRKRVHVRLVFKSNSPKGSVSLE